MYIETSSYSHARQILEKNHLLILRGNLHYGKRATAIHLILLLLKSENISEVNQNLEDFKSFQIEEQKGYIIDTLVSKNINILNKYSLGSLSEQLKNKNSYFVVTIDSRIKLDPSELGLYIANQSEFPEQKYLLEKHLDWYLKKEDIPHQGSELLDNSSVQELLSNHNLLPYQFDELAKLLLKHFTEQLTIDETLKSFFLRATQEIKTWFDQNLDLEKRTFMISLAVFQRSHPSIVIEESRHLLHLLQPSLKEQQLVFYGDKLTEKLKDFFAKIEIEDRNTQYGQNQVKVVAFRFSSFQTAVLSHVWNEYMQYSSSILLWLKELGSHSNYEIRLKASTAVGELCKYDFDMVREEVLLPWGNSDDENLQRLAAFALTIPVSEDHLAPQILNVLEHWSQLNNYPSLQWVATIAYSNYVGLRFPEIALQRLFKIAQSGDYFPFFAVVESLVNLFETGRISSNQYLLVIKGLKEWTNEIQERETDPYRIALVAFWVLMSYPTLQVDTKDNLPILLWLLIQEETPLDSSIVTDLIRRTLNFKPIRKPALQSINQWLKLAYEDNKLYKTVAGIIDKIVEQGTERERNLILGYLNKWKSEATPAGTTAGKILSVLEKDKDLKHLIQTVNLNILWGIL